MISWQACVWVWLATLVLGYLGVLAAYRNGVRDGYSNTWLPQVKKQIRDENLTQGRRP